MKKPRIVHVLTIDRLKNRQSLFEKNWDTTGIDIRFHKGYDYKDHPSINNNYYKNNIPHLLIGASFYKLLHELLETNDNDYFVCEDDARPTKYWHGFDWSEIGSYELLKCYSYELEGKYGETSDNVIDLRASSAWIGACAFIISRGGAEKVLANAYYQPFDYLISFLLDWRSTYPNIVEPYADGSSY